METLVKRRLTEEELLDALEGIYRCGGYDTMTVHGAVRVELSRERIAQILQESPYLEPGSLAHAA